MVTFSVLQRGTGFRPLPFKRPREPDAQTAKSWERTGVMVITMCSYSVNFNYPKYDWSCSMPHTTAWPHTLQLKLAQICSLPVKWAFGKEGTEKTCCRTSAVALQLPFSFTLLDEVFVRFIQVLLKLNIGNSLWKPHSSLRKDLVKPLQFWSFRFNAEGVIDSSWLSYTLHKQFIPGCSLARFCFKDAKHDNSRGRHSKYYSLWKGFWLNKDLLHF